MLSDTLKSIQPDFYFSLCGELSYIIYVKDCTIGVLHEIRRGNEFIWEHIDIEQYIAKDWTPGGNPWGWRKVPRGNIGGKLNFTVP